jgi:hypothetical protein
LRLKVVLKEQSVDREIEENSRLVDNITKAERIERFHSVTGFLVDPKSNRALGFSKEASNITEL